MKKWIIGSLLMVGVVTIQAAVTVSNLNVAQREGSKLVDIFYDIASDATNVVTISVAITNGAAGVNAGSLSGDVGAGIATGSLKQIIWDSGADWAENIAPLAFTVSADDGMESSFAVAPVAKTGQTTSYRIADDGDLEAGLAWPSPRFTDNTDGTVADNLTGLEWVLAPHSVIGNGSVLNWNASIDFCKNLTYASHTDWRLPTRRELASLLDYGEQNPALSAGHPFSGILNNLYWSSTAESASSPAGYYMWAVDMGLGSVDRIHKSLTHYVWPVRSGSGNGPAPVSKTGQTTSFRSSDDGNLQSGESWPSPRFIDRGDGTVTDRLTGLEWVKEHGSIPLNTSKPWTAAVDFCDTLTYANHSDWRLPSIKELESLMNYGAGAWGNNPYEWFNSSETPFSIYIDKFWSSTTAADSTGNAWWLNVDRGKVGELSKGAYGLIWPVRDGSEAPSAATVDSSTDSRTYSLTVASAYGSPVPGAGTYSNYAWRSSVTGFVDGVVSMGGTNYTCSGWNGVGIAPILGGGTNTGPIVLTSVSSSIDWKWIVDTDSDRMPDEWELQYFGSTTGAVATLDNDGDGYNAWQEYILGSNPTNSGSSFLFTPSPAQPTNSAFSVDFSTVTGRLYTVECTDDLASGNWQVLTNFIGDGSAAQLIDPTALPSCFYHVRIDWVQ